MKHTLRVTLWILLLFVSSQVVGLWILSQDIHTIDVNPETGEQTIVRADPWERPDVEGWGSVVYIVSAIFVGTILLLIIIKYRAMKLWRIWFFLAIWLTIMLALGVFLPEEIALLLGFVMALLKFKWPHIIIHNVTEVFLYSGIAVLLVPMLEFWWAVVLMVIIAAYDFWAVFRSGHMVTMAKFQSKSHVFAGLSIPYSTETGRPVMGRIEPIEQDGDEEDAYPDDDSDSVPIPPSATSTERATQTAVLGGGDIAFPLIFNGVLMEDLVLNHAIPISQAFGMAILVAGIAAVAVGLLLTLGKKNTFYPAMPPLGGACLLGAGIVFLLI